MIRASVKQWLVATTLLGLGLLLAACMLSGPARAAEPGSAARSEPKRVLILHSFGRELLPALRKVQPRSHARESLARMRELDAQLRSWRAR